MPDKKKKKSIRETIMEKLSIRLNKGLQSNIEARKAEYEAEGIKGHGGGRLTFSGRRN